MKSKILTMHKSITSERIMRELEADTSTGFCFACGNDQSGAEPDARGYKCEACGALEVYGTEETLLHFEGTIKEPAAKPDLETEFPTGKLFRVFFTRAEVKTFKAILKNVDETRQALKGLIVKVEPGSFAATDGKVLFRVNHDRDAAPPAGMVNGLYEILKADNMRGGLCELTLSFRDGLVPPNLDQVIGDDTPGPGTFDYTLEDSGPSITGLCLKAFKRFGNSAAYDTRFISLFAGLGACFKVYATIVNGTANSLKMLSREYTVLIMPFTFKD